MPVIKATIAIEEIFEILSILYTAGVDLNSCISMVAVVSIESASFSITCNEYEFLSFRINQELIIGGGGGGRTDVIMRMVLLNSNDN